ncbi:MAG: hypothetical protein KJT03_16460 [Verrucomicrobiae bacterium]|nr:hypothetical protein [Verrucomicrobiae bacterium]
MERWQKRFPEADANGDGVLTAEEAIAYRNGVSGGSADSGKDDSAQPRVPELTFDPGWDRGRFPDHAVSLKSPEEIKAIYARVADTDKPVVSYPKQKNGVVRIIGTGHSFMAPGYKTLPLICEAAGFEQPLYTHTGGGITGSARYKWEQENGIFEFDGKPMPKLLASIANAQWDVMLWGPYYSDRPEFYTCWIDFCLKYQSKDMKFYLTDAWIQLGQLDENPTSESFYTEAVIDRLGKQRREGYAQLVEAIREKSVKDVYIIPTSDAMTLAAKYYVRGELPGVEGIHKLVGGKERSLWRDQIGHLGPGFERLEGYVFYATVYRKSPELIKQPIAFEGDSSYPGEELDKIFRHIAWLAVTGHPLSGVTDANGDGIGD